MNKRFRLVFSVIVTLALSITALSQARNFNISDKVDVIIGGDPKPGVIVGGSQDSGYGYFTYQVHIEGEDRCNGHRLDTRYNADHIKPRFTDTSDQGLNVGDAVEVRRWDGSLHRARILSVEAGKYRVRFDGKSSAWDEAVDKGNIRLAAGEAQPSAAAKAGKGAGLGPRGLAVGDEVMYGGTSVLWTPGARVEGYDPDKRAYLVRSRHGGGDIVPCYAVAKPGADIDNSFFVGKWEMHIYGATTSGTRDGQRYRTFSGGMKLPPLEIKANGTYVWVTDKGTIRGKWISRPDGVPGVVLLDGEGGLDYTIYEKTEGAATSKATRDEIGLNHIPSGTGYYHAFRIGTNMSCVLVNRAFR